MKLFVGIDVSSEKLDVCFLTDDNQLSILSEISVANDIEGASFIRETILEFNDSYHFDQIVIGMESTSMYSFHPSMFFHEDEKLKKLNTLVTIENPFRVKQFSRMFDENKTDRNDALRIADFLRIQRFTTSPIKEEKYMALQRLTRTRYQLIKQLIRTKQHFLENLTYKFGFVLLQVPVLCLMVDASMSFPINPLLIFNHKKQYLILSDSGKFRLFGFVSLLHGCFTRYL
ncbi:hypothetical protein EfmAA818_27720 [Enterococcus faecium]|nr:hypothetical protein EfmAA818_27720 [Enterococcus faecium]